MRKLLAVGAALLLVGGARMGGAGLALAQGATVSVPADTIIAARQAGFDLQAGNVTGMKADIDAGNDVKGFKDAAGALSAWGHSIPAMFPDGTQTGHETHALPAVWSDRAGFQKAAENFWTQADKLAVLADANDKPGFAAQYTLTTQACGACHRNYRAKLN
jgi:cytochrome c556